MGDTNNEVVRVGQSDHRISRRTFLKLAGAAVASLVVPGCIEVNDPDGTTVLFQEVSEGQAIDLVLPNQMNGTPVTIEYGKHDEFDFTPLQLREDKKHNVIFQPFKDGASTVRMMGEITDPHIYEMMPNPELGDIPVHTYPSAISEMSSQGRSILDARQKYHVLRVVTRLSDYMGDRKPNAETNAHPWGPHPVDKFGEGACIGTLKMDNGKQVFEVTRFVQDLRALVPARPK
jgi:hypothetical protein